MKDSLLFYNAYQSFYAMAENSKSFSDFCMEAYGADFSQDGFSDINQVNLILDYIPDGENVAIFIAHK